MDRILFEKTGKAVWMSHLDTMRLMQRAFRRAGVLLHHSQGYTPHAYVSMPLPLSVGMESLCEILEYELDEKLTITPAEITLRADSYSKKYDGKPLTGNSYCIAEGALYWAHTITDVIFSGQQTQIGRSENLIVSLVIVDREGNDVTANYTIKLLPGTLTVTAS
jgi:hypothetical protein